MRGHKVESVQEFRLPLYGQTADEKPADCSLSHVGSARPSSARITVS